jgi:nucleoside-diphosphate-sugar epimerase
MRVLVTDCSELVGSEAVQHLDLQGHEVAGVDNNMRRVFFSAAGDTLWNLGRLKSLTKRFTYAALDICDRGNSRARLRGKWRASIWRT